MPAYTEKQRRFMGAELSRERAGKPTKTHMTEQQLEEFASKPIQKPPRSKPTRRKRG